MELEGYESSSDESVPDVESPPNDLVSADPIPTRYPNRVRHPPTRDGYISWDVVDQMLGDEP